LLSSVPTETISFALQNAKGNITFETLGITDTNTQQQLIDSGVADTSGNIDRSVLSAELEIRNANADFNNPLRSTQSVLDSVDTGGYNVPKTARIVTDEVGIYIDGEGKMPVGSYEKLNTGAAWALMEGHCGYAFPWGGEVSVQRYTSESANNQDFFEIGIDHGKNPTDATYAYAILPYASQEKIDTYAKNPDVEIIANNKSVQAVRERGLNIRCFAFYEAADVAGVCVDGPCLITLTADTVCVSDPTHELERLVVVLDKELKIVNKAPNMQILVSGGRTEIAIDLKAANGRKFEIRYKEV
jgi:hypothetical protein